MIKRALAVLTILTTLTASAFPDTKSASASTQVSLSVLTECTISATDMDLGVYNARTGASGTAHAKVSCNTPNATVFVQSSLASVAGIDFPNLGVIFNRTLTGNSDTIPYQFEIALPNPDFSADFGNNSWGQTDNYWTCFGCTFHNADFLLTGTVAPGFWKPAGQYTDLVTITLTYNPT